MPQYTKQDLSGQRFGRYMVLQFVPDNTKYAAFMCRCDCGVERLVLGQSLRSGATLSCGCYNRDSNTGRLKHGHSGVGRTKTYNSWAGMMDRCEWGGHPEGFAAYGSKGIRVDPRWHDFEAFLADMGERPPGTSIDRIDGAKGYAPGNCRWATPHEQNVNRVNNIRVQVGNEVFCLEDACSLLSVSSVAIRSRAHRRGGDYQKAFDSLGLRVVAWRGHIGGAAA